MKNISLKKAALAALYAVSVTGLLICGGLVAYADEKDNGKSVDELKKSISEKEKQLGGLEAEMKSLNAGRSNIQAMVKDLKGKKDEMSAYVTELDGQVEQIQENINGLNLRMEEKQKEIEQTEAELAAANAEADAQYSAMKERIRFMYETGDSVYMEMLLKSESFGDMLNKADYIERLSHYDREKLEEYRVVIREVELTKELLDGQKEVLEETKKAAQKEQDNINTLISEKEKQIQAYSADIATKEQAVAEYDAEIAEQNSIIKALEAQMAAEKEALDEATRIHYNGGAFAWPAPSYTRISDNYGWRMHPTLGVQKFHNGVDLAAPGGSPILAAYDGKVAAAGYSSSMGNYIMIDHGDGLYTIYMHASALYVSKGTTVKKGQKIAAVGSTGRSTGNHLHFGVRKDGNYVDPMSYL